MLYTPGDILLVDSYVGQGSIVANLIRAGERATYGNTDYTRWTHAALIVSEDGDLVEALSVGVRRTNISKYAGMDILVVSPPIPADDPRRAYAVRFALSQVGEDYDYLDFVGLAFNAVGGLSLSLHTDHRFICSGLVARATESYTEDGYNYVTEQMKPADLAYAWRAISGEPTPTLSRFGRFLDLVRSIGWALSPFHEGVRP